MNEKWCYNCRLSKPTNQFISGGGRYVSRCLDCCSDAEKRILSQSEQFRCELRLTKEEQEQKVHPTEEAKNQSVNSIGKAEDKQLTNFNPSKIKPKQKKPARQKKAKSSCVNETQYDLLREDVLETFAAFQNIATADFSHGDHFLEIYNDYHGWATDD